MPDLEHRLVFLLEVSPWRIHSALASPRQIEEELQTKLMEQLPSKSIPDTPLGMRMAVREAASSILYGTNAESEAFDKALKEKYSSYLTALIQTLRELTTVAKAADQVKVGMFYDVTADETLCSISDRWWDGGVTNAFTFNKGQYDPEEVKNYIMDLEDKPSPPPAPIWAQIEPSQPPASSRVLIITISGDASNAQLSSPLATEARRRLGTKMPPISVLHLGPDPTTEHLAEVEDLCASTGGYLLTCDTIHSIPTITSTLTQAFLARGLNKLLEERRENHAKLSKLKRAHSEVPNGPPTVSSSSIAASTKGIYLPSNSMLEGLRDVTQSIPWLWGRAIREWRARVFGIRDVAFSEPGPLGLEVAAPPPSWRIAATHPPASVLTLSPQTSITAISSMGISKATSRRVFSKALSMRPVGLVLGEPYIRDMPTAMVGHLACLVVAEVMAYRVRHPYQHNPPPVPIKRSSASPKAREGDVAGVPIRALTLVVEYSGDLALVARLGLCNRDMYQTLLHSSRTDRKSLGSKLIRYCLRQGALTHQLRFGFQAWCACAFPTTAELDREAFLSEVWLGFPPHTVLSELAPEPVRGTPVVSKDWLVLHRRRCLRRLSLLVDLCMPAYFGALDGRLAGRLRAEGVSIELAVANLALVIKLGGAGVLSDVTAWDSLFWSDAEPLFELLYPLRLVIAAVLVHRDWIVENSSETVMRKLMDVYTFQDRAVMSEALHIKLNRKWLTTWREAQGLPTPNDT
ncbi:hypothetical protein FOL47_001562 [Perkinsus chesapeaki]|uniref:Uncharacterized protein n=1 Tax=Perkinsus chesapeaki TaxID=330153 RepID=A0A7J6MID7_PERCH|nr:hypothetical protein FOL47_001562 [Perkinsus chesapeaki]